MGYFTFVYNMLYPILSAVLTALFVTLYFWKRQRRDFWVAVLFALRTVMRFIGNLLSYMPESDPLLAGIKDGVWIFFRLLLTFFYYKIILTQAELSAGKREKLLLLVCGGSVTLASVLPGTGGWYDKLLCYIFVWGFARLYPLRRRSGRDLALFSTVSALLLIQLCDLVCLFAYGPGYSLIFMTLFAVVCVMAAAAELISRFAVYQKEKQPHNAANELASVYGLTNREQEIVFLLLDGHTAKEIGELIFISEGTAKVHIHNIYQKLGITRRGQLSAKLRGYYGSAGASISKDIGKI